MSEPEPSAIEADEGSGDVRDVWGGVDFLLDCFAKFELIELLSGSMINMWLWLHGEGYRRFSFSRRTEWRGIDIERLLRRHGIRLWERSLDSKDLYFNVKAGQARFAEYVMLRAGVPLTSEWVDPRHAGVQPIGEPLARGPALKPGLTERILSIFLN